MFPIPRFRLSDCGIGALKDIKSLLQFGGLDSPSRDNDVQCIQYTEERNHRSWCRYVQSQEKILEFKPLTPYIGVIGLTTAIKIQEEKGSEYQVTIVAETFPTDPRTIKYTSFWAVGRNLFKLFVLSA